MDPCAYDNNDYSSEYFTGNLQSQLVTEQVKLAMMYSTEVDQILESAKRKMKKYFKTCCSNLVPKVRHA